MVSAESSARRFSCGEVRGYEIRTSDVREMLASGQKAPTPEPLYPFNNVEVWGTSLLQEAGFVHLVHVSRMHDKG